MVCELLMLFSFFNVNITIWIPKPQKVIEYKYVKTRYVNLKWLTTVEPVYLHQEGIPKILIIRRYADKFCTKLCPFPFTKNLSS